MKQNKLTGTFTGLKTVLVGGQLRNGQARGRKPRNIKAGFSRTFSNVRVMMAANEAAAQEETGKDVERRLSSINVLLLITAILETLIAVCLLLLIAHLV